MKSLKTLFLKSWIIVLLSVPLLLVTNCADPYQDGLNSLSPDADPKDWVAMLNELFDDAGIIVENQGSIQDAINEAASGEAIYIEPGTYQESLTINKPGIKLIGLSGDKGESVIIKNKIQVTGDGHADIINIQGYNSRQSSSGSKKSNGTFKITRQQLADKIAHYQFDLKVGKGQFDVVRIHRVVREYRPYQPVPTRGGVFMLHGASLNFEAIFLNAGADEINAKISSAFYLASKNIDVWGMDFGWTLVPATTTDFTFMKDWGVERDAKHTLSAMSVARLIRGLTRQGFGRMNLLGFSYGVVVGYAAAGKETQQHPCLRDVKGIIAVDQVMKYDRDDEQAENSRLLVCTAATQAKTLINNGTYQSNSGQAFGAFGNFAMTSPDNPSPLLPPTLNLNNYQAALFLGTRTYIVSIPAAPFWHFVGGTHNGLTPTGLLYTDPTRWLKLMTSLPPYQPNLTTYEARACACDEENVTFDDHIGSIKVPILYLGAGGAFGELGYYTSSLTASIDPNNINVTLLSEEERVSDYGHGDLFVGNEASSLVWEKLKDWLINHNAFPS